MILNRYVRAKEIGQNVLSLGKRAGKSGKSNKLSAVENSRFSFVLTKIGDVGD